jgi:HK97 family phage major capsid protein
MTTEHMTAPEIKSAPDTIAEAFDGFRATFEAFREANDQRLDEMERKQSDGVTRDKVDRIAQSLDTQKQALDQLLLTKARPAPGRSLRGALEEREHSQAFEHYIRRGDEAGLRALDRKAMSIGSDADGGYLVPDEVDGQIGRRLTALSPIRAIASVRQVSGAVLKKPFAPAGMAVGWVGETAARPQTATPQLAELLFPTMELYAMPAATASLLDDSAVDIDGWIASEVEAAFAEQEGAAFVNGDGVNKPRGFLTYDAVDEAGWEWGSLGQVSTGVDGAFAATGASDILIDAIYALKAGYRQNARFVMNRKTQAALRKIKDADGNYIWQPPASAGQAAALMGFPVSEAEDMPDIAAGSAAIAFGDFARGYLVVDRTGVRVLRDPYSAKPYVLFYTTKRVGGGVQDFDAIKLVRFAA